MADRGRRFERALRERQGITGLAERLTTGEEAPVRGGPFAGMRYPAARLAEVDAPVAKLAGTYEQELAAIFDDAISAGTESFIDVGCADGYFAVGLPTVAPGITAYGFDISRSARSLCAEVARLNGVASRVRVRGRFTPACLDGIAAGDTLMLCDIEGGERELFSPALVRRLAGARVLIEVHEFAAPGTWAQLQDVFAASHDVRVIHQQPRAPGSVPEAATWSEQEQRAAVCEFRPRDLWWAYFVPRPAA